MNNLYFPPRHIFIPILVLAFIIISIACGAPSQLEPPGVTPLPSEPVFAPEPTFSILPTLPVVAPTTQPTQIVIPPAISEYRRLTLEYPSRMRAGVEGDIILLTLEVDDLGNIIPTAQFEGNVIAGETIEIPDLYETHNVVAEARLDMAGMVVQPPGAIYESLKRGQKATFSWSIHPQETGKYRGTVWLHLNFSNKATGEESRIAVSAQIIEIEAVDFFGFSVNLARASGVIGSIVGGVVGFPFLEEIIRFVFRRGKRKLTVH